MKVVMVVRDLEYGIGVHTSCLTNHLTKLGVEVETIIGKGNLRTSLKVPSRGADIVHIQGSCFNLLGSDLPTVVTVHTLLKTENEYDKKLIYKFGFWAEKRTLSLADKIIVVNKGLVDELYKYYKDIKWPSISFIPNGIELSEFDGRQLDREDFFMSAGRDIPRKDFATFREGCKLVNVPYAEFHDAPREKLIEAYRTAKAFVCSSLYETGPLTILEAMAAKCPVICSNIPSVQDIVKEQYTGLLFEPGNPQHLAWTIEAFNSSTKEHINTMVGNAYNLLSNGTKYSWDSIAKQTLATYEELI